MKKISLAAMFVVLTFLLGCEKESSAPQSSTSASIARQTSRVQSNEQKIKEDIRFEISVDTESSLWPLVTFPAYKKQLPGQPARTSRFGLVVRNDKMKLVYQRLLNDEDVQKGGVRDLSLQPGKYTVALETINMQDGFQLQHSNRVAFELIDAKPAILATTDVSRLRLPEGISRFWRNYNTERVQLKDAEEVLAKVRQYEAMDVHKSFYYAAIPTTKVNVAQAYCRDGQTEKAFELLDEVRNKGFLPVDDMSSSAFDSIRETDHFKELEEFAEKESNGIAAGPYLVLTKPICKLEDLLKLTAKPELPSAESLKGQPVVVYTGPGIPSRLLQEIADVHEPVIAITGKLREKGIKGVQIFATGLPPRALAVDGTSMLWIADADGNVVYNQRRNVYCDDMEPLYVLEYLKAKSN